MKVCVTCRVEKDDGAFESARKECKPCRQKKRTEAAKNSKKKQDPLTAPHVDACHECGMAWSPTKFKWRTDTVTGGWRSVCNRCYNDKKYYETYRKKKREENEDHYLEHNAHVMKQWRVNNPEKVKALYLKRQADVDARWGQLLTSARFRGKFVAIDQCEGLKEKMMEPCFYCGFEPPEKYRLNGLDCVDPDQGYSLDNTVAACVLCNMMKTTKSIDAFVCHSRRIRCKPINEPRTSLPEIMRKTKTTQKETELTAEELEKIHMSDCDYCGLFPALGVDRKDSDGQYTLENVVPCCSECNYAKKDLLPEDFRRHVGYIKYHTRCWVLQQNVPLLLLGKNADWCYSGVVNGRYMLTLRPENIQEGLKQYPATDFHALFETHFTMNPYDVS